MITAKTEKIVTKERPSEGERKSEGEIFILP